MRKFLLNKNIHSENPYRKSNLNVCDEVNNKIFRYDGKNKVRSTECSVCIRFKVFL